MPRHRPRVIRASVAPARTVDRRGFSLIEMMMAVIIMMVIFAALIPFMRTQTRQLGRTAGDLDALQNARYAQNAIDRELRIAGAGVVPLQMMIVRAAPMALTFNADLTTRDSTDPNGVYYDPNVDTTATYVLPHARAIVLPLTTATYPGQDYTSAPGVLGTAQTISYWLVPDPTAPTTNIYTLYRRVNDADSTVVSNGISVPSGKSFFQYFKINQTTHTLDSIPYATLPLYHSAVQHGSPADSAASAQTDSIRAISMSVTGMYNDPAKGPVYRTVTTTTRLLNAGLLGASACGDAPIAISPVPLATKYGATDSIVVTWTASIDQNSGEKDVEHYIVYRRPVGNVDWGDPATTFSAGTATYHWVDPDGPNLHGSWQYNVIAQDCTPANSGDAISNTVTLP